MYKRHLTTIFLASIFLIPISMGFGLLSPYTTHMTVETNSPSLVNIHARIADQGNVPFSINMFDNKSVINVNRTIAINDYGSAVLTDSIKINITNSFDLFNISFAPDVAASVHYGSVSAESYNRSLSVTVGNPLISNTTGITTYPIVLGNLTNQVQINLVFSLTDVVTNNKATLGSISDSILPYHFQANLFYPWYSIPITKYMFTGGTNALFATQNITTGTKFLPIASDIGATYTTNFTGTHRFQIYTLDHLKTINYTILSQQYGYNPNLTSTGNFIPAFNPNFKSNMTQNVAFDFYLDTMRIEYTNVDSIIAIDSWSAMYRTEIITIENVGVSGAYPGGSSQSAASNGVYPFRFFYPIPVAHISDVSVSDALGNLTSASISYGQISPGYPTNITLISIAPRVQLLPNQSTTFTINYKIADSAVMSETGGFFSQGWNVSTPIMTMFNWTIRHLSVQIIFPLFSDFQIGSTSVWNPTSVAYSSTSTNAFIGFILPRPEAILTFDNVSYISNQVINVHYSLLPVVGWFVEPSVFIFFFFILGLVYVSLRVLTLRLSPVVSSEPSKEEIPYDLIEGFVRYYQEKTALRTRVNNLELKKAQIKKVDFDKQKQTLDTKVANTERELIKYTQQLSEKGSRYREAIRSLELAETEREDYLKNLNDLDKKKRQQRLRPEIYSRMKDDYTKRLKKVNSTIDHVLIDLRGLLTEKK